MNWFLAYLLLLIIIILLFWVGLKKDATWGSRIKGWSLLILPVPIYLLMTGYFTAYYQHVRDCKADGGLKVLIQPEKVEQVQLDSYSFGVSDGESYAKGFLYTFYPKLKLVEDKSSNGRGYKYFSYSVTSTSNSKYLNDWTFNKIPVTTPSDGMYVISEHKEDNGANNKITKYEWRLTRNNKIYAKITNYSHMWRGIQYPDAIPSWSCWDGYSREYLQPENFLIKLILK